MKSRKLWGVMLRCKGGDVGPLYTGWLDPIPPPAYHGEPTRALLFCTRNQARIWCDSENTRPKIQVRFYPVRVVERLERVR